MRHIRLILLSVSIIAAGSFEIHVIPPRRLAFSGRVSHLSTGAVKFDWPGTKVLWTLYNGTRCSALLNETQENRYAVYLSSDSSTSPAYTLHKTFTTSGNGIYTLFEDLPAEERAVMLVKTTEAPKQIQLKYLQNQVEGAGIKKACSRHCIASAQACGSNTGCSWGNFGTTTLGGLVLEPSAAVGPPRVPWRSDRQLLFIGDRFPLFLKKIIFAMHLLFCS